MVTLSIIIVSWNTCDLLSLCLKSLQALTLQPMAVAQHDTSPISRNPSPDTEVIVVDNASSDESVGMVRKHFPWVHLVENTNNVGFAHANNQAIRQSLGRYVLLLNSDTEVYPGALESMVQFMDRHPRAGACGPRLLNADGSLQPSCHPMLTPGREFWRLMFLDHLWRRATYAQERWDLEISHPVEVIKGACFLLRREALEQVGLLDEAYFMYTEEVDLCFRLLRSGWQLWWLPQAVVKHYGEASSKQMAEDMYIQLYQSKVQFYRKFGGERRARCFKRLLFVAYGSRLAFVKLGAGFSSPLLTRQGVYRRLLAALPHM